MEGLLLELVLPELLLEPLLGLLELLLPELFGLDEFWEELLPPELPEPLLGLLLPELLGLDELAEELLL